VRRRGARAALPALALLLAAFAADGQPAPEPEPGAASHRRLVLCLDGTWNNAERPVEVDGGRALFKPTNVLKLYRAVRPMAADGASQIAYYNEGVGAFVGERTRFFRLQVLADRVFGGAFGGGFEGRVKEAYRFLVGNHRAGDEVFVFGFSRGSAQARSLVRFIAWAGGLLEKDDEYYIPELFEAFKSSRAAPGAAAATLAEIRRRRGDPDAVTDPRPVAVRFLGVFDSVLSLGSRLGADRTEGEVPTVGPRYAFHVGATPPPIVRTARQALAIDEARWDYRPHVWRAPASAEQSLAQLWFPGVHTNVGGGQKRDGLANAALQWMAAEARAAGLEMDDGFLGEYGPSLAGDRPGGRAPFFRAVDALRGKRGRGVRRLDHGAAAALGVHRSALRLLIADPAYRPRNLLDHLAAHPELAEALGEADRAALAEILRAHAAGR
jgi:uncharacterized protein (DUF2235 family)